MKKNLLLLSLIMIIFSCHKTEVIKIAIKTNNKKTTTKDTIDQAQKDKVDDTVNCIDVVIEILTTAPSYVEDTKGLYEAVVKNGGTSIGITIEGSPNPERDKALDYSKNYVLSLHETYPDRMPTIARYTFDPSKNELYEYNTAEDSLMPITFNKDLLLKYHKTCK
ncbi:hypothetical protein FLA105534_00163 [Flavobacterium bizetiae]|uniref:Lipoprotein n=1 Tax=Flavobacterium bizetiae TaxID=2704140 RepID=A0A6J4G6G3_9FLAO|nr:hypothetical protein [Flavobacterium bizetiae]CAA9194472.1 hypothetical protein FLA105534_00163 [Flavobacterium bizetiae]CAD5340108.1 hypothetical protein FLA105535_00062 [Flavobacterium bizetiae]CAD5346221.1 hypothetical protein FLA105534_00162 [Flavobacterium bizetiae]